MWYKYAIDKYSEMSKPNLDEKINIPESPENFAANLSKKYNAEIRLYLTSRNDLKLDHLVVPKTLRNQGIGSSIMREITDYADRNNLRLILTTGVKDPNYGTTSSGRLKKFYKQFGLKENKGKDYSISENMLRTPQL
jgi:predicted GNAT family acetyltransferase